MISFIVPAHNEQAWLGRTLPAIHESARVVGQPYEIIVVDDASTDATAEVARQHDGRVVSVNHRQIAATRNSGARAAQGDRLIFVDADTTANPRAVVAALRAMDRGAVGGGAPSRIDLRERVPLYGKLISLFVVIGPKLVGFTGGAFMFCTRAAFHATGGFNERLYWSEEGSFALALKREGRFVVLWTPVITSGRRFRKTSALQLMVGGIRMIFFPVRMTTQRASVEKIWYDSNREDDDEMPRSVVARISNGIALVVLLVALTGPLWNFVPWAMTPLESPVGQVRFVIRAFLSHVGFVIFWPSATVLLVNLLRQKRWTGWIQSLALITFCLWQAWACTRAAIWVWAKLYRWLEQFYQG